MCLIFNSFVIRLRSYLNFPDQWQLIVIPPSDMRNHLFLHVGLDRLYLTVLHHQLV